MRNLDEYRYENQMRKQNALREEALLSGQRAIYGMSKFEKESAKSTMGCFTILGSLITIGFLFWFVTTTTAQMRLDHDGIETEGTIYAIATGRWNRTATYTFKANDKAYTNMVMNFIGRARPGDTVTVRYLPSDPEQSDLPDQTTRLPGYLLGLIGTVAPGVWAAGAFVRRRQLSEPEPDLFPPDAEQEQGPEWATKPYQDTAASLAQNLPPADAMPLNDLPGDRR